MGNEIYEVGNRKKEVGLDGLMPTNCHPWGRSSLVGMEKFYFIFSDQPSLCGHSTHLMQLNGRTACPIDARQGKFP